MGRPDVSPKLFRVNFTGPLTNATRVSPDAPLAPFRRPTATAATATPATPPPPPAANLWETAVGRELAADRETIQVALKNIQSAVADLRGQQTANLDGLRNAAVELSLTIAAQLLHREVTADEFPVENMVRDMAAQLVSDDRITVWLNPDDVKLLEKRLGGRPLLPDATATKVVADPTLARCECRVEGGDGALLMSDPSRHLQEIRDELLRNLANARNARP
jgi:flagellar biosynthesis/type III secretory pathway protein FliH